MKFTVEGLVVGFEQYEPPSNYLYCKADPAHEQYEWLCENVFSYEIDGVKYFAPGATGRGLKTPENPQGPLINTSMAWKTSEQDWRERGKEQGQRAKRTRKKKSEKNGKYGDL